MFNPRTAGGLSHLRTAGGGYPPPPQRTRKLKAAVHWSPLEPGRGRDRRKRVRRPVYGHLERRNGPPLSAAARAGA